MKSCELCESPARMYCESDQASLCWDCDLKIHAANFLVARHSRRLLCHVCQSPTPWSAAGARLGPTVTVCEKCSGGGEINSSESDEEDEESGDDDDDDDDGEEGEEEEGDNQVVPWSSVPETPPPPCSSSSDECSSSSRGCNVDRVSPLMTSSLKRGGEDSSDLHSQEDPLRRSPSWENRTASMLNNARYGSHRRPLKLQRTEPSRAQADDVAESMIRIQQELDSGRDTSMAIAQLYKLSRDPGAVDHG